MATLPFDLLFRDHGASAGFAKIGKAATDAATATERLDQANARLAASERKVADAASGVRIAEARLEQVRNNSKSTAVQRLAAEENLAKTQRRLSGAQAELKVSTLRVGEAQKVAAASTKAAAAAAAQSETKFQKAANGLKSVGRVGFNATGKMASGLKTVGVGAGVAVTAIGALVGATVGYGLKVAAANENAQIGFTTMLGSARKAEAFLKKLQDFAAKTPFEFPELQRAAQSLISVGVSAKNVIPIMTTLGNVTSGMGTGAEGVQRATVALQQMQAAGRITAEDLNQLRDAGIPLNALFNGMSDRLGVSSKKLFEMSRNGELGRKELNALMDVLQSGRGFERFNGMMDKQSRSLNGMLSTLKDTFGQGMARALEGAIPFLKGAIGSLTKTMERGFNFITTKSEVVVNAITAIGNGVLTVGIAFTQMAVQALNALSQIGNLWNSLSMVEQASLKKLGFDGSGLAAMGKAAGDAANVLGNQLIPKLTAAQEKWVAFGKDQASKAALRDSIQKTANALSAVGHAADGSRIQLKHWGDRSKLSADDQATLRKQINNARGALSGQISAMRANGASHKALSSAVRDARNKLAEQFRAMGLSSRAARELASRILHIPKRADTKYSTPGAKAAENAARRVASAVRAIPGRKNVYITTSQVTRRRVIVKDPGAYGGPVTGQGVQRRQAGGIIPGWSPHNRADNIPILATAGEYMHQVQAVKYWGGGFMDAVNKRNLAAVRRMVGARNITVVQNISLPNYVGSHSDIVNALVTLKRQGRLDVVTR